MEPLEDHVEITPDPLSLDALVARVHSPSAGAIVTFVGTTRDVFEGKPVDRLEYECYAPMAEKKMRELVVMARERWDVVKVAIAHRTGTVAVPIRKKEFFEGGEVWKENAEQRREPRPPPSKDARFVSG